MISEVPDGVETATQNSRTDGDKPFHLLLAGPARTGTEPDGRRLAARQDRRAPALLSMQGISRGKHSPHPPTYSRKNLLLKAILDTALHASPSVTWNLSQHFKAHGLDLRAIADSCIQVIEQK